jgi:hypothetical protein
MLGDLSLQIEPFSLGLRQPVRHSTPAYSGLLRSPAETRPHSSCSGQLDQDLGFGSRKRRGWDSNPRTGRTRSTVFETVKERPETRSWSQVGEPGECQGE